jgi:hypothetical protein
MTRDATGCGSLSAARPRRRVIRELAAMYVVPDDLDPIRVLLVIERPNNDGGTGSHLVYVCLCEEIDSDA